jgi:hypothetical protein
MGLLARDKRKMEGKILIPRPPSESRNQTPLQPPLPLQLFWPLQLLLSLPPLQLPCPLQEFLPLQSCLPVSLLGAFVPAAPVLSCASVFTAKPVINPVMAAATSNVLCVLLIIFCFCFCFCLPPPANFFCPRCASFGN